MATTPKRQPDESGDSGVPIKRGQKDVPEAWLVEVGELQLAENVDRLAGDVDLVTGLALARFEGPDWDYFANELAKYGYAVIASWIGRRMIFERCKSRGLGGLPSPLRPFTDDDVASLTDETVAKALRHFRTDVLMKQKWDPTRGATLRTYFIGQCLIRFPNVYRRWLREEENRRHYTTTDDESFLDSTRPQEDGPEHRVIDGVTAELALATVKDPRVRHAMVRRADGWSHADIAAEIAVSEKTVERMIANERARLRKRGIA